MFFREKKTSRSPTLQLVENKRTAKGTVSQRVVVSLGECRVPDEYRKAVAQEVSHRAAGYQRILQPEPHIAYWTEKVLEKMQQAGKLPAFTHQEIQHAGHERCEKISAEDVEHEEGAELGPFLVLDKAWAALELDRILKEKRFSEQQIAAAKISVFNRLSDPVTENVLPEWAATTGLGELLGVHPEHWGEDRFYRVSDKLLTAANAVEEHLRESERTLFNLDRTILLYDLTNSYFEGTAAGNDLARRSAASKEKRSDCPLISVGVVLDAEGFVITHKVFPGNISDCRTLMKAVQGLEKTAGEGSRPVVVVDGGMATEENLKRLRGKGYEFIVNGKRRKRAQFASDFLQRDNFKRVQGRDESKNEKPVFVRRIRHEGETVVLCRSEGRREKENAIQDRAERTLTEGLEQLEARIMRNDPRLKLQQGSARVQRAIGRLTARTTQASKLYDIEYEHATRTLRWNRQEKEWSCDRQLHGCYHLRSSLDLSDQQLWRLYMTLTRVEDSFRSMKSELGLRPFHHQMQRRCRAHIWITVLAYHLLRWTEFSLKLQGYECTWNTLKRRLKTHCYATVVIPTAEGLEHHRRKPGRPNQTQKLIYSLLGIDWHCLPVRARTYRRSQCAKV